jgi:hypothetical protein
MKAEMRQKLAREPFAEKIRKVGQLVRLAKTFPRRERAQAGKLMKREDRVVWTGTLPDGVNSANAVPK